MKKFSIIIAAFLCALFFVSCKAETTIYEKNLFEVRDIFYEGESQNYEVVLMGGMREKDYKFNGQAGALVPYFLVKVTPKTESEKELNISFSVDKKYDAKMQKMHGTEHYYFDFGKKMNNVSKIIVKIDDGGAAEEVACLNLAQDLKEDYRSALAKAIEKYKLEVGTEQAQKDIDMGFETAIRLSKNRYSEDKLVWHFMLVRTNGQIYGSILQAE